MNAQECIRCIFIAPKDFYDLRECARLLGLSADQVLGAVDSGEFAMVTSVPGSIPKVPWHEVAIASLQRWPQEFVEAALGEDLPSAIPSLVRLTALEIRLPAFDVIALEHQARRENTTLSAVITHEVMGVAEAEASDLERVVPGFREALSWPNSPES